MAPIFKHIVNDRHVDWVALPESVKEQFLDYLKEVNDQATIVSSLGGHNPGTYSIDFKLKKWGEALAYNPTKRKFFIDSNYNDPVTIS